MYLSFTSEWVMFMYRYQLFLLAGIVVALLLARNSVCWLPYFIGLAAQFGTMFNDYTLLSRAGYGYAMGRLFGISIVLAIVGAVRIGKRHSGLVAQERNVIFFCPTCLDVHEGTPGEIQGCPNCHKRTQEMPLLWKEWKKMTPEAQDLQKHSWVNASAPIAPDMPAAPKAPVAPAYDPEATVPSRETQAQPKPTSVLLTITSGPMAGAKFRCREGNPVFIGRDPSRCNLVLNGYTAVSGAHCRLDVGSGGLTVTDLNSSNGTFIGNVRLTPNRPASAANGVEIRLANTDCIFRVRFE